MGRTERKARRRVGWSFQHNHARSLDFDVGNGKAKATGLPGAVSVNRTHQGVETFVRNDSKCGDLCRYWLVPHSQKEEPTQRAKEETLHIHQEHDRQRRRRGYMNCRKEIDDQVFSHPKTAD